MADGQNTPGFIPDTTQSAAPTQSATPGFIPDTSANTSTPPASQGVVMDTLGKIGEQGAHVATGMAKGVGDTVSGVSHILNKIPGVGETLAPSQGMAALDTADKTHGNGEEVGKGLEGLVEFAAGDEALEGILKGAKVMRMAKMSPEVAQALDMADKSKTLHKIMTSAGKGAFVGGVQGAVKGAATGDAAKEAAVGAGGGALGGALGETAGEIAGALGKRFGIGTTAVEDATRGAKPGKRNYKFADDFQKAAPRIDAEAQASKPQTLEDWADATTDARKKLWAQEVQPLVDQYKDVPLDGDAIANDIRAKIPETMTKYSPTEAKKMEELANQWIASGQLGSTAQALPSHNTFVGGAEDALEHYNALVAKTGYWSKTPTERAALMRTDGELAGNLATADAIRDELYNKLDILEKQRVAGQPATGPKLPTRNIQDLKKTYGSLRNVENEIRGQVNVQGRQSPISLKEAVGLMTGLGRGGLTGGAMAAIPAIDRAVNAPEKLISRAVQKAARPGEEGIGSKAAMATRKKAGNIGATAVSELPRIYFQDSQNGDVHSVPADQIHEALKIDPKLTIVNGPEEK